MWLVYDDCDCGDPNCYGKTDFRLFESEQTARQEADMRAKRHSWFSFQGRHIEKLEISTRITGY